MRGTPQQIIEKYQTLASDALLSGDRVAHENFLQHSEHYTRLLGEAQREINERREAQEAQNRQNQQNQQAQAQAQPVQPQAQPVQAQAQVEQVAEGSDQPDVPAQEMGELFPASQADSGLVETPENKAPRKRRSPRKKPEAKKPEAKKPAPEEDTPAPGGGPVSDAAE